MRPGFCYILILLVFAKVQAQTFSNKQRTIQIVFEKLVEAYASPKIAPQFEILPNSKKERIIATYSYSPSPTIKIDEQLVDICLEMKDDSLNALAILISHELAHYYNDHNFCIDYAYAQGEKSLSINAILKEKEAEADYHGIWHAAIAGYYPFSIFGRLIETLYKAYKLPESFAGYPSKAQRKANNNEREEKAANLVTVFEAGNILTQVEAYEEASTCFEELLSFFSSRENYNNAGVANLLAALQLKPTLTQTIDFIYPMELDPFSRLEDFATRGGNEDLENRIEFLLKKAKKYFEKAISLDATYATGYINLACVLDILGNPEGAIGRLNELPHQVQETYKVFLIKGIAYFHTDNQTKAAFYFDKIHFGVDSVISYDLKLYQLYHLNGQYTTLIDSVRNNLILENKRAKAIISDSLNNYFKIFKLQSKDCQIIRGEDKISICISKSRSVIEIKIQNYTVQAMKNYSIPARSPKLGDTKYRGTSNDNQVKKWLTRKL